MIESEDSFELSARPRPETKTGRVWTLADEITERQGRRATRPEVMAAFQREGGNPNTASTQYSQWRADFDRHDAKRVRRPQTNVCADRMMLTIGHDGRLLIPIEVRRRMMIGADGRVAATLENGELRLAAPSAALRRLQQLVREMDRGEGSVVDELLSDRRSEAQ